MRGMCGQEAAAKGSARKVDKSAALCDSAQMWEMSLKTESLVAGAGTEPLEQGYETVNLSFFLIREKKKQKPQEFYCL